MRAHLRFSLMFISAHFNPTAFFEFALTCLMTVRFMRFMIGIHIIAIAAVTVIVCSCTNVHLCMIEARVASMVQPSSPHLNGILHGIHFMRSKHDAMVQFLLQDNRPLLLMYNESCSVGQALESAMFSLLK